MHESYSMGASCILPMHLYIIVLLVNWLQGTLENRGASSHVPIWSVFSTKELDLALQDLVTSIDYPLISYSYVAHLFS
jgi:hypothetical protein